MAFNLTVSRIGNVYDVYAGGLILDGDDNQIGATVWQKTYSQNDLNNLISETSGRMTVYQDLLTSATNEHDKLVAIKDCNTGVHTI